MVSLPYNLPQLEPMISCLIGKTDMGEKICVLDRASVEI